MVRHDDEYRPEDLFLHDLHVRRGVGDEGRRDVAVFGTEFAAHDDLRALGARVFDQRLDAFEVPRIDDAWIFRILVEAFAARVVRSEEHTSELQSLMRISYAVFCLKKKNINR